MSNNMFSRKVNKQWLIEHNESPISGNRIVLGVTLPAVSYQPRSFGASQVITAFAEWLNPQIGNYVVAVLKKMMYQFSYSQKPGLEIYKGMEINLPTHADGAIAFDYMEAYIKELEAERIKELEAFLIATGLNDYALTDEEQRAIDKFRSGEIRWGEFAYKDIFDHIVQGSRLKKNDQFDGDLPFVMSGTTNTGIVRYIGNSVRVFPRNSLTVDIFGSVFYRNYDYGMGDDTGAFWNENKEISKFSMLYIGSTVAKSLLGKFDYGHKLRSSRTLDFKIKLPVIDNQPDYEYMNLYISAIEKLVIRGVVEWKDKQIEATKSVINEK